MKSHPRTHERAAARHPSRSSAHVDLDLLPHHPPPDTPRPPRSRRTHRQPARWLLQCPTQLPTQSRQHLLSGRRHLGVHPLHHPQYAWPNLLRQHRRQTDSLSPPPTLSPPSPIWIDPHLQRGPSHKRPAPLMTTLNPHSESTGNRSCYLPTKRAASPQPKTPPFHLIRQQQLR
jgi:hypothetical protein